MGKRGKRQGQGVERERRFLVDGRPPGLGECDHDELRQGYLVIGDEGEVRVREIRDAKGARRHVLTVKIGRGGTRAEEEIDIEPERFAALWRLTSGRRIEKRRYKIPYQRATIELDVYRGTLRGRMTAEVEFEAEREARRFVAPEWFGEEVTGRDEYTNRSLAVRGWPEG